MNDGERILLEDGYWEATKLFRWIVIDDQRVGQAPTLQQAWEALGYVDKVRWVNVPVVVLSEEEAAQ